MMERLKRSPTLRVIVIYSAIGVMGYLIGIVLMVIGLSERDDALIITAACFFIIGGICIIAGTIYSAVSVWRIRKKKP